jgi:hypothetical protein
MRRRVSRIIGLGLGHETPDAVDRQRRADQITGDGGGIPGEEARRQQSLFYRRAFRAA